MSEEVMRLCYAASISLNGGWRATKVDHGVRDTNLSLEDFASGIACDVLDQHRPEHPVIVHVWEEREGEHPAHLPPCWAHTDVFEPNGNRIPGNQI